MPRLVKSHPLAAFVTHSVADLFWLVQTSGVLQPSNFLDTSSLLASWCSPAFVLSQGIQPSRFVSTLQELQTSMAQPQPRAKRQRTQTTTDTMEIDAVGATDAWQEYNRTIWRARGWTTQWENTFTWSWDEDWQAALRSSASCNVALRDC